MPLRFMNLSITAIGSMSMLLVLIACGGGGGGGTPSSPSSPTTPSPSPSPAPVPVSSVHYLLSAGDNLLAIDPNNTSSIVTVSDKPINILTTLTEGNYNSSTQSLENNTNGGILYEQGGTIYFAYADGAKNQQVSNETQADTICGQVEVMSDYSNINNARFVYQLPGTDGICGSNDDVYRMVKLSMGASDSPIAAAEVLAPIGSSTTNLQPTGWVGMTSDGTKYYYSPDFDSSSPLPSIDSSVTGWFNLNPGYSLYAVANGVLNDYYIFDENKLTSSASYFFEGNMDNIDINRATGPVYSHGVLYFVDGATLYSKSIDTSGSATVFADNIYPLGATLSSVDATENYIVVVYQQVDISSNLSFTIERYKKSDASKTTIVDGAAGDAPALLIINGDNLAYTLYSNNLLTTTTYLIDASGSVNTLSNAHWAGLTPAQTLSVEQSGMYMKDLIIEDESGNVSSYDMSTLNEVAALGTAPTGILNLSFNGYTDQILATGLFSDGTNSTQSDLFFADLSKAGSLQRLTNTPGINETSFLH